MQLVALALLLVAPSLASALRQAFRSEQSLRVYVYDVNLRDFGIPSEVADKYESWLDMSTVPVPHGLFGVQTDIEQNHVLHSPAVGFYHTVERFGLRVYKPEDANLFWLPVSNVMLCLAAFKWPRSYPNPSARAWTCNEYVSILKWVFKQESWQRHGGADHVFDIDQIPLGFDGLGDNSTHKMLNETMSKSIFITKEDRSVNAIQRIGSGRELIVPYFVDRHQYLVSGDSSKTTLASFVGSGEVACHVEDCSTWNSLAIRERIMAEFRGANDVALVDLGGNRLPTSFNSMSARDIYTKSIFCVAPPGDSFSSARFFAVLMASCIPVNINDNVQLPFEETLPVKWSDFSVNIEEKDVLHNGVLDTLRKLAQDKALISKMQLAGQKAAQLLSYTSTQPSDPTNPNTAQTMILEQLGHIVGAKWHANH